MANRWLRNIFLAITLIVGNSVFMILLGPIQLSDYTYGRIYDVFGSFLGSLISMFCKGGFVFITYGIIFYVILKLFPDKKAEHLCNVQGEECGGSNEKVGDNEAY